MSSVELERVDALITAANAVPESPTKRHLASDVMLRRGFNPIEKMVDLAEKLEQIDDQLDHPVHIEKRIKLLVTLAKLYAPTPKSVDINITGRQEQVVQVVSFGDLYEQRKHLIPEQSKYNGPRLLDVVEAAVEEVADD